jgi:5'-methylthioadenosine phosphorylase
MEGPLFSTRAESHLYRSWGADIINMSVLPEAKLAREAEIVYQMVCMSTDYDCWKEDEEHVTVEAVIQYLTKNAETAKKLLAELIPSLGNGDDKTLQGSTKYSIITAPEKRNPEQVKKLKVLFPEYF